MFLKEQVLNESNFITTLKHDWGPKAKSYISWRLFCGKGDEIHWCSTSPHLIPHGCRVEGLRRDKYTRQLRTSEEGRITSWITREAACIPGSDRYTRRAHCHREKTLKGCDLGVQPNQRGSPECS